MDGIATDRFVAGADLPDARALREAAGLGGSGRDLIDAVLAASAAIMDVGSVDSRLPAHARPMAGGGRCFVAGVDEARQTGTLPSKAKCLA